MLIQSPYFLIKCNDARKDSSNHQIFFILSTESSRMQQNTILFICCFPMNKISRMSIILQLFDVRKAYVN